MKLKRLNFLHTYICYCYCSLISRFIYHISFVNTQIYIRIWLNLLNKTHCIIYKYWLKPNASAWVYYCYNLGRINDRNKFKHIRIRSTADETIMYRSPGLTICQVNVYRSLINNPTWCYIEEVNAFIKIYIQTLNWYIIIKTVYSNDLVTYPLPVKCMSII